MKHAEYTVTLAGKYADRVPPRVGALLLGAVEPAVRSSILMAFERRGAAKGRPPRWLEAASDIRFRGISGHQETLFHFEAPLLGEAAEELYRQEELWERRPSADDSGFDLLGDVITDIDAENRDSELFDDQVLRRVSRFRRVLDLGVGRISFSGHRYTAERPAAVSTDTVERARDLSRATPAPQPIRLVGKLDMIRDSTQGFALLLDTGEEAGGIYLGDNMGDLADLFKRRIIVTGRAVFRASGRLLRIDAEHVVPGDNEGTLWSKLPQPRHGPIAARELRVQQGPRSGLAAIIGRWPGDENEDEINAGLSAIS